MAVYPCERVVAAERQPPLLVGLVREVGADNGTRLDDRRVNDVPPNKRPAAEHDELRGVVPADEHGAEDSTTAGTEPRHGGLC